MTQRVRTTTRSPKVRQYRRGFAFLVRFRSLFRVIGLCAILSALYAYFGNAVIHLLLVGAVACLAVIWSIDTSLAIRDIVMGIVRRRSPCDDEDGDSDDTTEGAAIEILRMREDAATARYNERTGPLEDVLRARALRLEAEIRLLREHAARRLSRLPDRV